eukprot:scaffold37441_cov69-Phaeocystis_antarctica.AAC.1
MGAWTSTLSSSADLPRADRTSRRSACSLYACCMCVAIAARRASLAVRANAAHSDAAAACVAAAAACTERL